MALVAGTSSQENGDVLAHAMKFIIIPLISRSFELKQHEIVNEAAVNTMVKDMFDPAEEIQGTVFMQLLYIVFLQVDQD